MAFVPFVAVAEAQEPRRRRSPSEAPGRPLRLPLRRQPASGDRKPTVFDSTPSPRCCASSARKRLRPIFADVAPERSLGVRRGGAHPRFPTLRSRRRRSETASRCRASSKCQPRPAHVEETRDVSVGHDDALGGASAPGGVDHIRGVVWTQRHRAIRVGRRSDRIARDVGDDHRRIETEHAFADIDRSAAQRVRMVIKTAGRVHPQSSAARRARWACRDRVAHMPPRP